LTKFFSNQQQTSLRS